jgi:hypothetical protein
VLFQRTGGVFSVTLSVNVRFRERCPHILRGMLPMVFGLSSSESCDSPAIICHRQQIYHIYNRRKENHG